nr:putative iron(III) ABC transporter, ATP-binding protein [uncultured archaeon]
MKIEVKNAGFCYSKEKNIFEDISFEVEAGDNFSILGPNGCGKTTLLKSMLRILRLKQGAIHMDSKNIESMKRSEIGRKIGYVPQTHGATFPYTVLQMVLMGRASHLSLFSSPSEKDGEIAKDALEIIGISHLMEKPYTNVSGGEAQLVLIARALAAEPDALILDEPTSHLDFRNQILVLETLNTLAKEKEIAIIMTTHYPNHALLVSNKALLLNNNKTVQGKVEDIITESNLRDAFGLCVRIISYDNGGESLKTVVPLVNFKDVRAK